MLTNAHWMNTREPRRKAELLATEHAELARVADREADNVGRRTARWRSLTVAAERHKQTAALLQLFAATLPLQS